jgi:hypothetical protein
MKKSRVFIAFTIAGILVLYALYVYSVNTVRSAQGDELNSKKELVGALGLTDFAIWTEARYTRHPSQADIFAPFQDFPSSLEHFPAGSVLAPRMPDNVGP